LSSIRYVVDPRKLYECVPKFLALPTMAPVVIASPTNYPISLCYI